jgi:hypothetical protein
MLTISTTGSSQADEDFNWDDEEEESSSPTDTLRDPAASVTVEHKEVDTVKASFLAPTPGTTSPSQSEGSYDIVSGHASNASESALTPRVSATSAPTKAEDESEESDWE